MIIWLFTIGSVFFVSLLSFVGVFSLALKRDTLKRIVVLLVSLAAGTLFGDAFLHLIPEAYEHSEHSPFVPILVLFGIIMFFIIEKFVHWHHCHDLDCSSHTKHLAPMNLIGDAIHNLIDGMLIAASYSVDIQLGIVTTIAVIFHEIPQEIGDFGVLIYSGMEIKRALFMNFLSALTAVLGALIILIIGHFAYDLSHMLIPITAGGFIYIAGSDLIPELHNTNYDLRKSLYQFLMLMLGMSIMYVFTFVGHMH